MIPDDVFVRSVGVHLPDRMSGDEAVRLGLYDEDDMADSGLTGALVAGTVAPVDLAVAAGRAALHRAGSPASTVDLLVHTGAFRQGPELWSPTGYVARELGCRPLPAYEVRQGCNGVLAALELVCGQFALDPGLGTALVTTGDNFGAPCLDRWRGGGPGFVVGDAGSAVLVGHGHGVARVRSLRSLTVPELEGMHRGHEPLHRPDGDRMIDMTRRATDFASGQRRLVEATRVMIEAQVQVVKAALADVGLVPCDLARVLYTNGAAYLVHGWLMEPLGLPMSRSAWTVGRTMGHLGASDQVVALEHLLRTGALAPGDHVLMTGGSPGYTVCAVVLTVEEGDPSCPPS